MKRAWATLTKGDVNALCEFQAYKQISNNLLVIFTYEIPMGKFLYRSEMIPTRWDGYSIWPLKTKIQTDEI